MGNNRLYLVGGDMVLRFNQPLTEKQKKKLVKTYKAVGWCLFYYDEVRCEIAFQRGVVEEVKLPSHSGD